ncbi:L-type lectin-domain containing receptor kinase IV.1-like [Prosopis cineraria]|uniref:L-type lectin-domain containing receptor kinase IV.1-like n=1 Tax=Prosopis cineraria TaxID=364024 RepID=UPI00240FE1BB|nr:L-type lectin-domain containing receptor kinase IV.1-like [Prosopis cineraria]
MSANLMATVVLFLLAMTTAIMVLVSGDDTSFVFNGFRSANLTMGGDASVNSNGLLQLTNETKMHVGHAFYPSPLVFTNTSSFSTTFVFAIRPFYPAVSGHGIAFVISPTKAFPGARPGQYIGLFNETTNGDPTNHVFAAEFDTMQTSEFGDIDNNHVGIDINGLNSTISAPASYCINGSHFQNLSLISGLPMQAWVDYDGGSKQINVTLAPINVKKPETPLLKLSLDLSHVLTYSSYVGFSSSAGSLLTSHYVLGWSFKLNGVAQNLDVSQLPKLPRIIGGTKQSVILSIGLSLLSHCLLFLVISSVFYYRYRKRKFSEVVEEWEQEYGPHRFKYKDLYIATKGFGEKELLGCGGFGKVYRGTMPGSKIEVAVKKVSNESRQGVREFVAEIVSIGRLRHRNLVPLLGYCRRRGELLLVYDYMPNGSLDKYIHNQPSVILNWAQRFKIIKGVALVLRYLHEECEKVVVHRDIKASNIMLDSELNGRLGDFGLARLYDHGSDPQATRVVGTFGYLAPEQARTGRARTRSDVYAFGAFLLEVACGRKPIERESEEERVILVDWVYGLWSKGEIIEAKDGNLGREYSAEEVELVLKLGLLCSSSEPLRRPSMRQVVLYLNWEVPLPDMSCFSLYSSRGLSFGSHGFCDSTACVPSYFDKSVSHCSVVESLLSGGR